MRREYDPLLGFKPLPVEIRWDPFVHDDEWGLDGFHPFVCQDVFQAYLEMYQHYCHPEDPSILSEFRRDDYLFLWVRAGKYGIRDMLMRDDPPFRQWLENKVYSSVV